MIKKGNIGSEVQSLQRLLGVPRTGFFDETTEQAVREFQTKHGLIADGIVGDKTLYAINNSAANPQHLTSADIQRAAKTLGVDAATVLAVNSVESAGTGFLPDGRIKILYERHIMYKKMLAKKLNAQSAMDKFPNLVNQQRGGYSGGTTEHARLKNAKQIDEACALESCSYGLYQIMGFHWQALGYDSVQQFVQTMEKNEGEQLNVFVQFIIADSAMHKALKAKKWAEFAKLYNGSAYKENFYDIKLAQAYAQNA